MAAVSVNSIVSNCIQEYLKTNKNASEQDCQVAVRNHLQELKQNGTKISDKKIAQANAQVGEIYKIESSKIRANLDPTVTPKAEQAVQSLNKTNAATAYPRAGYVADVIKADRHYDSFNNLSKKARQNLHKRNLQEVKAAFASDEYMTWLKEKHPDLYQEMIAEQNSSISANQTKKLVRESEDAYVSSKKRKQAKKAAEIKSQQEHKAVTLRRAPKDKALRKELGNAKYCTSQGIMTQKARKIFRDIKNTLNGQIYITVSDQPNKTLQAMRDYYSRLESQAPAAASIPNSAPVVQAPKTTPKSPAETPVKPLETAAEKAAKGASETASKLTQSGKAGWIAAGVMGALSGLLLLNNKQGKDEEQQAA